MDNPEQRNLVAGSEELKQDYLLNI